jgi:hypothetical protein
MASMTLEEVEKALYVPLGAPVVRYNESQDSFMLLSIFIQGLAMFGPAHLAERIKTHLPGAKILNTWTWEAETNCCYGTQCVEFTV